MRLGIVLVCLALTSGPFVATASAQVESGDLGVYFDQEGAVCSTNAAPFVMNHQFYVLGIELGEIAGYEFAVTIDPLLVIFSSADMTNPGRAVNVGQPPLVWIVGVGLCLPEVPVVTLVQFTYGYFASGLTDMMICLGPSSPSSFNPPAPGYLDCLAGIHPSELVTFPGDYPAGCAVVNPTGALLCEPPVATQISSWGAMKAAY